MTAWKVSPAVGNVKNDEPGLIVPIQEDPQSRELISLIRLAPPAAFILAKGPALGASFRFAAGF